MSCLMFYPNTVTCIPGKEWIKQMLVGASLFPALTCGLAFLINFIAIYYHASRAIPFFTMVSTTSREAEISGHTHHSSHYWAQLPYKRSLAVRHWFNSCPRPVFITHWSLLSEILFYHFQILQIWKAVFPNEVHFLLSECYVKCNVP